MNKLANILDLCWPDNIESLKHAHFTLHIYCCETIHILKYRDEEIKFWSLLPDGMLVHFRVPPAVFKLVPKREIMEQTFFYKKTNVIARPCSSPLARDYRPTCFYMI